MFQLVKIPAATGDGNNWGGYAHVIFGLGSPLPENLVTALPQWDNANKVMVPGTKVVQLDVYYDDTVDPDFDWDTLLAIESVDAGPDVYDTETALGYNIDLHPGELRRSRRLRWCTGQRRHLRRLYRLPDATQHLGHAHVHGG